MCIRDSYKEMTIEPGTVESIDRSVVIHPALSEAAAWVTHELVPEDEYEARN